METTLQDVILTWLRENGYVYEFIDIVDNGFSGADHQEGYVFRINNSRKRLAIHETMIWLSDDWEDCFAGYFNTRVEIKIWDPYIFTTLREYIEERIS